MLRTCWGRQATFVPALQQLECLRAVQAVLEQEARIAGFKSEVQKSQELHHSSLTRDTDRLQTMLDKVKAEIRYRLVEPCSRLKACCLTRHMPGLQKHARAFSKYK